MRILPLLLCLFLTLTPGTPLAADSGPAQSIAMLQKAIDTQDAQLLLEYLDLEELIRGAASELWQDEALGRLAAAYPPLALFSSMGEGGKGAAMLLLATEAMRFISNGVSSGAFAGESERKEFGAVRILEENKHYARLATSLYDGVSARSYPLELGLSKTEGIWRVTELLNVRELATY